MADNSYIVTKSSGEQVLRTNISGGVKEDVVVSQPKNTYKVNTSDGKVVYRTQPNAQGVVEETYANPIEVKEGKDTFIVTGNTYNLPVRESVGGGERASISIKVLPDLSVLGNLKSDREFIKKDIEVRLNILKKGVSLLDKPRKVLSRVTGGKGEEITAKTLRKIEPYVIKGYEGYKENKDIILTRVKRILPQETEIRGSFKRGDLFIKGDKILKRFPKTSKVFEEGSVFLIRTPAGIIESSVESPVINLAVPYGVGKAFVGANFFSSKFFKSLPVKQQKSLLAKYGGKLFGGSLTIAYASQVINEGRKELRDKGTLSKTTGDSLRELSLFSLASNKVSKVELEKLIGIKNLTTRDIKSLKRLSRKAGSILRDTGEVINLKSFGKKAEGRFISKVELRKRNIARQSGRETYQQKTGRKFTRQERKALYNINKPNIPQNIPSGKIRVVSFDRKSLVLKQIPRETPFEPKKFILKEVGQNKIFIKKGKSIVGKIETPIRKLDYIKERVEIKQDVKVASGNQFLLKRIKFNKGEPIGVSQSQILVEPKVITRNINKFMRRQYIIENKSLKLVSEQKVKPDFYQRQEVKLVGREKVKAKLMQSLYKQKAKLEEERGLVGFRELFKEVKVKPKLVKKEIQIYQYKPISKTKSNMGGIASGKVSDYGVILEDDYVRNIKGFNKIENNKIVNILSKDKIVTLRNYAGVFKTHQDLKKKSLLILPLLSFDIKSGINLDIKSVNKVDINIGLKFSQIPKVDIISKLKQDVDVKEVVIPKIDEVVKSKIRKYNKRKVKEDVVVKEEVKVKPKEVIRPKRVIRKIRKFIEPKPEKRRIPFFNLSKKKIKVLKLSVKNMLGKKQKTAYTYTLVKGKKKLNLKFYTGLEYR